MKNHHGVLKRCPLFDGIDEAALSGMLTCLKARVKSYGKNETVIAEGDKAEKIGIVLEGSVQIEQNDYYGNRSIVGKAEAGELFAETFACAHVPEIPVSVVAAQGCKVMFIDCKRVTMACGNACEFHTVLIYNLMQIIAQKNLAFHRKIEITSKRTTREKLMAYLNLQAKRKGSSFTIPYSRQELADYLSVERSGLSAEIGKLKKEGVIDCRKNKFTLL